MRQVTIYRAAGQFAGWPANYGIWNWDEEIVVGFTQGYHASKTDSLHTRDMTRPFINQQARSKDGGQTWKIETFNGYRPGECGLSADEHMNEEHHLEAALKKHTSLALPDEPIDFLHPDFALMAARTGLKEGVRSMFYFSYDRCKSWQGPFGIPMFNQTGVAARTDYILESSHQCLLFLTANKRDGKEGRVFCARMREGGKTIEFVAYVGDEPAEKDAFALMPASLKLPDGRILCAIRCRGSDKSAWIDLYDSSDNAQTWQYIGRPVKFSDLNHSGNPPTLHQLPDGRLVMVYGRRDVPYAMVARLSDSQGQSWSDEIVLRNGAGSPDLGYPRTAILPDGKLITVYYFNDRPDGDGERFIEATIWKP